MTRKIASLFVALTATVALLTGCGASNPITTAEPYSPSDGVRIELSDGVRFENLFFLTAETGSTVRPMGSIVNGSANPAQVTITVADVSATYDVPANEVFSLQDEGGVLDGASLTPGTNTPTTVTTAGSVTKDVPVLDGTIPPYDQFLPQN